jgi:hypothetical protein
MSTLPQKLRLIRRERSSQHELPAKKKKKKNEKKKEVDEDQEGLFSARESKRNAKG